MREAESLSEAPPVGVKSKTVKVVLALALLAVIVLAIIFNNEAKKTLTDFLEWVEGAGALGPLVYIGVYIVATVMFLPGSILTIGAGFVFNRAFGGVGILVAVLVVFVGASVGATIAFLLGRTVLRDTVDSYARNSPTFKAIDSVMGENGLKLIFLLRLSPLLPFNASNYIYGITAVTLRDYILGCGGLIPGVIAFVLLGTSIGSVSDASGDVDGGIGIILFVVFGTLAALGVSIYVSILAKREIQKIVGTGETAMYQGQGSDDS